MEAEMISFVLLLQQTKPTQMNIKVLDVEKNFDILTVLLRRPSLA